MVNRGLVDRRGRNFALGMILIVKYGEVKKIETDDVSLCLSLLFSAG